MHMDEDSPSEDPTVKFLDLSAGEESDNAEATDSEDAPSAKEANRAPTPRNGGRSRKPRKGKKLMSQTLEGLPPRALITMQPPRSQKRSPVSAHRGARRSANPAATQRDQQGREGSSASTPALTTTTGCIARASTMPSLAAVRSLPFMLSTWKYYYFYYYYYMDGDLE